MLFEETFCSPLVKFVKGRGGKYYTHENGSYMKYKYGAFKEKVLTKNLLLYSVIIQSKQDFLSLFNSLMQYNYWVLKV